MARVIIAIGGNIGDMPHTFVLALKELEVSINNIKVSDLYISDSLLEDDQAPYHNIAIVGDTKVSPHELLNEIKHIETKLGRTHSERWKERVVDIDIIDYASVILSTDHLSIPHIHMRDRVFVILPMMDITPEYIHPETGEDLPTILTKIKTDLNIKKIGELPWQSLPLQTKLDAG